MTIAADELAEVIAGELTEHPDYVMLWIDPEANVIDVADRDGRRFTVTVTETAPPTQEV
jgi:hypothetical protein